VLWCRFFGVIFALCVFLSLEFLVGLGSARAVRRPTLAVHFLQIVVAVRPVSFMLGLMGSAILRAHGEARRAMIGNRSRGYCECPFLTPIPDLYLRPWV